MDDRTSALLAFDHSDPSLCPVEQQVSTRSAFYLLAIIAEIDRHFLTTGGDQAIENVTAAIRQAVSQNHDLAAYAICLIRQSTIAKTSSGKIQRHVCRKLYLSGELVCV